jgi:hypothetical protein
MKLIAVLTAALLAGSCAGGPPASDSPPAPPPPEEPPEGSTGGSQGEFVVSEEVYSRTFEQVGQLIENLNNIIRNADYDSWLSHLSEEYIRTTSDPAYLREQSEKPLLRQADIRLHDLHDYFVYVVVPSRTQATLDEIEFLDENHVKAIALLRGQRVILYLLELDGGEWKIGVW